MANHSKPLDISEVRARLSKIISNMPEPATRRLLKALEQRYPSDLTERHQSNFTERRKYPRQDASIYVLYSTLNRSLRHYTRNISRSGLYLETEKVEGGLVSNQKLSMTFFLPDNSLPVKTMGKIVRFDRTRFEVQFDEIIPFV